MCAAREPRRINGLCDTYCWFGHLSCDCLLQPDRIYSEGAHILGSRILLTKHANGNYVQATKVAHDGSLVICLSPGMPATTVPSAAVELLYGDLSGAMPASTGGSVYCFFIVDCYSNLGWLMFLKDKSADTVTHAFHAFLAAIKPLREKHGEPGALRTDNGTEFNEPFANLLVQ